MLRDTGRVRGPEGFRTRRLDHTEFPDVYPDANYLNVRIDASQVTSGLHAGLVAPLRRGARASPNQR